jgi:CheY-like chemotaxis protein
MQVIVDWLKTVERLAYDLYREASDHFAEDKAFSAFLHQLAQDEAWHFHLMSSAADYLRNTGVPVTSDITLPQIAKDRVETPLRKCHHLLREQDLSKRQMIQSIAEAEFSELNTVFLYAINTLKQHSKTFEYVAAVIQEHETRIERFLDTLPDDLKPVESLRELPTVWEKRFLVVEDDEGMRLLLNRMLSGMGIVEMAENGKAGLERVKERFYNVIISDIDMPIMDGLEFYAEAVREDPNVRAHFMFCSGGITPDRMRFLQKNNLHYLMKPVHLSEVRQMVDTIAQSASEQPTTAQGEAYG